MLDALADGGELGTNELARRTSLHPSSVSRLLATLADAGLVEHVADTGRYRLGLRLVDLGNAVLARLDLREIARPHLRALVEATGETATLSAPGDPDAITVDFVQSGSSVQSVARLGRPSVAHATATGKVVLAFSEAALPDGPLAAYTERTIVDPRRAGAGRSSASASRAGPGPRASASTSSTPSRRPRTGAGASSRPSSACRGRPRASTRRRWRARSSRCSRVQRRSRTL